MAPNARGGWCIHDRMIAAHLPAWLLRPAPAGLLLWQWLALPLLALVAWALALALARLTAAVFTRTVSRTRFDRGDTLARRLTGPLRLGWWVLLTRSALPLLELKQGGVHASEIVLTSVVVVALFWALLRLAEVLGRVATTSSWATTRPFSRALMPLAVRSAKVALVALSVVAVLSVWGVPVASLLAGLGIGGLALALAAQKTVENLFGSFSIGIDQPFREGDFVKVEDFVGTVEAIGLRSTRFRTLDRTLITVPNGKLADMRLESFTVRDRFRLACTVGLVYETTPAQMKAVLEGLEGVLRAHPKIWPDAVVVRFKELAASSLDIEVMAWFQTADWGGFQLARQEVLLGFMEVVERAGSSFAFPTRTVHLEVDRLPRSAEHAVEGRLT